MCDTIEIYIAVLFIDCSFCSCLGRASCIQKIPSYITLRNMYTKYVKLWIKILIENFVCLFDFSDSVGYSYCGENGLNFAANAAYSEDDDFPPGKRNKPSRVGVHPLWMWMRICLFCFSSE